MSPQDWLHFNARLELQEEHQLPLLGSSDYGDIEYRQLLLKLNPEKKGDNCKAEQGDERLSVAQERNMCLSLLKRVSPFSDI